MGSAASDETLDVLGIDTAARAPLRTWLALLADWNKRIDLTAARSDDELVDLMLADAALLAKHVARGARVVDVGTGAGAPGLALALMRPDLDVTLVEPLAKRASFLRTVVGSVNRPDVKIFRERGDATLARVGRAFDVATSRATLAPLEWVPLGLALAPLAWALLARDEPPAVAGTSTVLDVTYNWPRTGAHRRAVVFRSTGD